jgi:alanine racemase
MFREEISRVYAKINLNALRSNMESMYRNIKPDTKIVAVIKTDAYGHGALPVAAAIEELPYLWGYAVATVDEAVSLIEDGRKKPILILGISFPEQYHDIVKYHIRPAVCDYGVAEQLSRIAAESGETVHIHIPIDTGMSRIGYQVTEETAETIAAIAELPNLEIEGIFTHFAKADEPDKKPTIEQISRFQRLIGMVEDKGIHIPLKHCSNSAGIIDFPEANMNLVRAGITMYGMWPSEDVSRDRISLCPVMSLKSHISFIKTLEPGREISYGGTYVTKEPRKIATIPVGYGDGYARSLSNKGYVLIRGQRAYICGRVCMDQFMVDVTDIPEVREGDKVTLLGHDGAERITMEDLGSLSGRFNYEFACLINQRVPRVYEE